MFQRMDERESRRVRRGGLSLTRRAGEQIDLLLENGESIVVSVVQCGEGKVRLHTSAPRSVKILRSELVPLAGSGAPQPGEAAA